MRLVLPGVVDGVGLGTEGVGISVYPLTRIVELVGIVPLVIFACK
jgi:hypothetical protein